MRHATYKTTIAIAIMLTMLMARTAQADEADTGESDRDRKTETKPEDEKLRGVIAPVVGATFGSFFDVPVKRVSLGFEGGVRFPSTISVLGSGRIEPGQTENGLGAHRLEIGATIMGGRWLRVGAGLHGAYAMILRRTEAGSFWKALGGDIGGLGFGAHALAGLEVPLGSSPTSVELLFRGTLETYGKNGNGWSLGPVLAVRF